MEFPSWGIQPNINPDPKSKNLRDPSNLSAIVSRNVFCGANSPFLISLPKSHINKYLTHMSHII